MWSKKEIKILTKNYGKISNKILSIKLNKKISTICGKAASLGLKHNRFKYFSLDEFLEAVKTSKTHTEARIKLGYSSHTSGHGGGLGKESKYRKFLIKYNPDISHFSLQSRSLSNNIDKGLESFYHRYRESAIKRGIEFSISLFDFKNLVNLNCYYCGGIGDTYVDSTKENKYCGLDRQENNIGYIKENCVPCCKMCNFMKHSYGKENFLSQINKIYTHQHRFND